MMQDTERVPYLQPLMYLSPGVFEDKTMQNRFASNRREAMGSSYLYRVHNQAMAGHLVDAVSTRRRFLVQRAVRAG